ncbi:unnamed protein product [Allacma fusca]|uniref:Uncharacterized protein n=1 Tax=Allacma fusca TaxID=39272 RepID=A0A8J2P350_9HEXA|nr:unnamed protein product [Allacma fusca]
MPKDAPNICAARPGEEEKGGGNREERQRKSYLYKSGKDIRRDIFFPAGRYSGKSHDLTGDSVILSYLVVWKGFISTHLRQHQSTQHPFTKGSIIASLNVGKIRFCEDPPWEGEAARIDNHISFPILLPYHDQSYVDIFARRERNPVYTQRSFITPSHHMYH